MFLIVFSSFIKFEEIKFLFLGIFWAMFGYSLGIKSALLLNFDIGDFSTSVGISFSSFVVIGWILISFFNVFFGNNVSNFNFEFFLIVLRVFLFSAELLVLFIELLKIKLGLYNVFLSSWLINILSL